MLTCTKQIPPCSSTSCLLMSLFCSGVQDLCLVILHGKNHRARSLSLFIYFSLISGIQNSLILSSHSSIYPCNVLSRNFISTCSNEFRAKRKLKLMIFLRQGHKTITVNQAIEEERIIYALLV